MNTSFSTLLLQLRTRAQLTNHELACLAKVPESLISGLQNNNRRVGEYQARKIADALKLEREAFEQFVYSAIDTCNQKVLKQFQEYPSALLNLVPVQLNDAGLLAGSIIDYRLSSSNNKSLVNLFLDDGATALLETSVTILP